MAELKNSEKNLTIEINLNNNNLLDFDINRSDYENWIPFYLSVNMPNKSIVIDDNVKATMTFFELKNLIQGLENVLVYLERQENYIYDYNNSESFFELKLEVIPEDGVIETEIWVNIGSLTKGEFFGYDEGVRLITSKEELKKFLADIKCEMLEIIG